MSAFSADALAAPHVVVPPLMSEEMVNGAPLDAACVRAVEGCDAGLITWHIEADTLAAALIFAPEVPLSKAVSMLPLCGVGLQNALGSLAPPEIAVHLGWDGRVEVNGANCGHLSLRASHHDPEVIPDWLVVGMQMTLMPANEETGLTPDQTDLASEGCGDIAPHDLISAWARHCLHWISTWENDGPRALHEMWSGLAIGMGQEIQQNGQRGMFTGVDENFGMLMRLQSGEMQLYPLTDLLKDPT